MRDSRHAPRAGGFFSSGFRRRRAAMNPTTATLLQHLSLLFVPAGVGVMLHLQRLGDEALAIGVALVLSTLVGLASAALTMAWLMKRVSPPSDHDPA